jgi:flagellar motor protein MotB
MAMPGAPPCVLELQPADGGAAGVAAACGEAAEEQEQQEQQQEQQSEQEQQAGDGIKQEQTEQEQTEQEQTEQEETEQEETEQEQTEQKQQQQEQQAGGQTATADAATRALLIPALADAIGHGAAWFAAPAADLAARRGQHAVMFCASAAAGRDVAWLGRAAARLRLMLLDCAPRGGPGSRPGLPLLPEPPGPDGRAPPCVTRDLHAAVGLEAWRIAEVGYASVEELLACPALAEAFTWAEAGGRRRVRACG